MRVGGQGKKEMMIRLQQLWVVLLLASVVLAVGVCAFEVSWLGRSSLAPVLMAICGAILLLAGAVAATRAK